MLIFSRCLHTCNNVDWFQTCQSQRGGRCQNRPRSLCRTPVWGLLSHERASAHYLSERGIHLKNQSIHNYTFVYSVMEENSWRQRDAAYWWCRRAQEGWWGDWWEAGACWSGVSGVGLTPASSLQMAADITPGDCPAWRALLPQGWSLRGDSTVRDVDVCLQISLFRYCIFVVLVSKYVWWLYLSQM